MTNYADILCLKLGNYACIMLDAYAQNISVCSIAPCPPNWYTALDRSARLSKQAHCGHVHTSTTLLWDRIYTPTLFLEQLRHTPGHALAFGTGLARLCEQAVVL